MPDKKDPSVLFSAPNQSETEDMDFKLNTNSTVPLRKPSKGNAGNNGISIQSTEFLSKISINEIDPSQLISLKELGVCVDPEEEFNLKTKLATRLTGSSKCNSNHILYFFKYTESGYTLQVDIYNPTGAYLNDKCSVLRQAIECVDNTRKKGVAQ